VIGGSPNNGTVIQAILKYLPIAPVVPLGNRLGINITLLINAKHPTGNTFKDNFTNG
jgi:hypothetical protein